MGTFPLFVKAIFPAPAATRHRSVAFPPVPKRFWTQRGAPLAYHTPMAYTARGRGKRSGLRLIYFWIEKKQLCDLLYLYAKNEQGDLTAAQARTLA